jgi:tetratricopeptide (TPR) repeat protein
VFCCILEVPLRQKRLCSGDARHEPAMTPGGCAVKYVWWRGGQLRLALNLVVAVTKSVSPGAKPGAGAAAGPGGAAVARAVGAVSSVGEAAGDWSARREAQAALLRMSRSGRPIRVREVEEPIRLGIHPAADLPGSTGVLERLPPFIPRDVTPQLAERVKPGAGFVLVVGESTAGKTRLVYEAMRELLPAYKLVVPDSQQSLGRLVPQICQNRRVVLWLDDLNHYLSIDGLTARMIQQLLAAQAHRVIVLATMSAAEHARFSARGVSAESDNQLVKNGREILAMAHTIRLERVWTEKEIEQAREHGSDPRIAAAIKHAHAKRRGVAEYLAAAPELLSDWKNAWAPGTHPRGAALVAAAVDARRAGYHKALPIDLLKRLHEVYLEQRGGAALRPEPWKQALAWATEALHATSSLLLPKPGGGYLAFDYLHGSLDAQQPPPRIPEQTWRDLVEHVDAAGAFDIGVAALARGDLEHASRALEKAVGLGESRARLAHARCVCDAGDPQRATLLFAELIEESTRDQDAHAEETFLYRLGHDRAIGEAGRHAEAARLFQRLVADTPASLPAGHPYRFSARIQYAFYTGLSGDPQRAIDLFEVLLGELRAALGAEHSYTLNARFAHALFTGEAGRPARAERLFANLVADRTRLQGAYARYTLNNRRHHAHFLGEAGHAVPAAELFRALTTDCLAVFDDMHPDTLASRYGEARFVGEAGDPRRAAALLKQLLDDEHRLQVSGPDSPFTLLHRRHHARFIGEAGDPQQAVRLLKVLEADTKRLLGPRHPEVYATRIALARFTGTAGRIDQAVKMYERLVDECRRQFGEDHQLTLSARNGHARFLGKSGQYAQAAELFEFIFFDRMRVLGGSHPCTLNSRNGHANFVGLAGDRARAARLLQAVLGERERLFGADHPWTRQTREELERFTS